MSKKHLSGSRKRAKKKIRDQEEAWLLALSPEEMQDRYCTELYTTDQVAAHKEAIARNAGESYLLDDAQSYLDKYPNLSSKGITHSKIIDERGYIQLSDAFVNHLSLRVGDLRQAKRYAQKRLWEEYPVHFYTVRHIDVGLMSIKTVSQRIRLPMDLVAIIYNEAHDYLQEWEQEYLDG